MKRLPIYLLGLFLAACQSGPTTTQETTKPDAATAPQPEKPANTFGETITADGAVAVAELPKLLGSRDSARVKLVGTTDAVCQAKGCWLTMQLPEKQTMRVRFRDYAFFVPKDIAGKTVVVEGWAHRREVPVDELQHYAKDGGKSAKEIAAITKPETQLSFMADGVLVR
ncbi:DUF4920 domain-containing protein [Hymenobacter lutimineralis]|uniref:DUF4920 domain-containing protein n=1 Tax=Hymenobacter lutimineralis TaxID=2606448 RepID=A0A5D6V0G7_9BACT|nr:MULTISPECIES: DUF4920 domain-containing protein [Hymenobacter]QIX63311.1 DUF4920 domain-containing protein [Hymenobacter sp. BT18]TYZ08104.1 DUF4920 domain-containing protein [Hymenobacter lutimineralis]